MHSSNSGLTHREYVDKWLAVSVAVSTFVGYVCSIYWDRTLGPRLLLRREMALENKIDCLVREADEVCTTSKLLEHSRLMRHAAVLRRELLHERRKRYRYQLSMESMLSPLSTVHSVRRNFTSKNPHDTSAAPLCEVGVAHSASNSRSPSPVSSEEAPTTVGDALPVASPTLARCATQRICDVARYNLIALVKYLLRFGHLVVFLSVFGSRPGLIAMPPSMEDSVHFYLTEVVGPYVFDMALFGPAVLFAPRQTLPEAVAEESVSTSASLAQLGGDPYAALTNASERARMAGSAGSSTILLERRYNTPRLCESNDLVWWFVCCLCASYWVVRVFFS